MARMYGFLLLILVGSGVISAQNSNLGIPFMHAFSKDVYQSGAQNWDIVQGERGIIYFANNNGLLSYDGLNWKTYPLPNETITRSLAIGSDGVIYIGGQNEFGVFTPSKKGVLTFRSLKKLIPKEYRNFEDVWDIVVSGEDVFFRASSRLYWIHDESCTVLSAKDVRYLGMANNRVIIQVWGEGVMYFDKGSLEKVEGSEFLKEEIISAVLSRDTNTILLVTQELGLFLITKEGVQVFETDADDFLKQNNITTVSRSKNGQLALGTDFAGVLVMEPDGKSIYHLDRSKNLLNNKVFSTCFDQHQNLWLGVDNGINYIKTNSPFTIIHPDGLLEGTGFAAKIFKDQIYLATSNGLYTTNWKNHYHPLHPLGFELVENTKGQSWGLDILENQLLLGHNDGAFIINDNKAQSIYTSDGVWNFEVLTNKPNYAIGGTYKNFLLLERGQNGVWKYRNDFTNWYESSRFVEQDQRGNIWMSHPYRGVFKIKLEEDYRAIKVKKYGVENNLPSAIQNHLFKLKGELVFCGEKGIYRYEEETDNFQPYTQFNEIFGTNTKIRRLFEAPSGDVWFIAKNIGILQIEDRGLDKKISLQEFPQFKNQLNAGFESIYPYDDKNVFITHDKGFIHYNPSFSNTSEDSFNVLLNQVRLTAGIDSLLFAGYESDSLLRPYLQHRENALQFQFSATDYTGLKDLKYQYMLEGFESNWSTWSAVNVKEYTNLPPGTYTFKVQAKNRNNNLSSVVTFDFQIKAPWYKTKIAYLIYSLLLLLLISGVIGAYRKKYYGLKQDRDQTIKESAEMIGRLEEEKMKAALEYKQRELASTAMHVVQKNETLEKVKERLQALQKLNKDKNLSEEIRRTINMLQQDELINDGWEQFMLHFNQLHGDFYNRLKSEIPALTPKDLKLCTYLRMNLSTKEIASLLNVTVRGVEASRYRIRKKIQLSKEENLTEFLMNY